MKKKTPKNRTPMKESFIDYMDKEKVGQTIPGVVFDKISIDMDGFLPSLRLNNKAIDVEIESLPKNRFTDESGTKFQTGDKVQFTHDAQRVLCLCEEHNREILTVIMSANISGTVDPGMETHYFLRDKDGLVYRTTLTCLFAECLLEKVV